MNAALLADCAWFDEEVSSFHYLVVGLIDEQVRVIQVMPEALALEDSSLFGQRIGWVESRWPSLNRRRLARLDERLEPAEPHLIHALTGRLWRGAAALGNEMNLPVIFNANSSHLLGQVDKLVRSTDPARIAFAAATEPLAQGLRERLDASIVVEPVPTAIHLAQETLGSDGHGALCVIVTGNGMVDRHYLTLLQGMVSFCQEHPAAQFFFEGQGSDQHTIWKAASRMGLLANVSLIPRRLGHRELLLRADVLIHPQPLGQSRSITLQAMAHGLTVIAHEDPWLDYLIDGQTAWVTENPQPDAWNDYLERVIGDPDSAKALGRRARQWVREEHLVADQIPRVLNLYRRMTGQTIQFPNSV